MTKFEEIYKLFLNSIQDYHLQNLLDENFDIFDDLLETFLIRAIPNFKNCVKPIKNIDTEKKEFLVSLDLEEKNILSDLMVLSWLDWNNNNVIQMNVNVNDNDYSVVLICCETY